MIRKATVSFLVIFGFFLTVLFFTTDGKNKNSKNKQLIVGTWYWKKSSGGTNGTEIITPKSTGVDKKIVFNANKKVTVFTNGTETGRYTFTIKMGKSILDNQLHYLLTFNEMRYVIQYIDEQNLNIQDNFVQGYVLSYTK